jgi:hypothetical protein
VGTSGRKAGGANVISDLGLCLLSLGTLPTGMTEHTKNLLRAFYELSQTHRGNGIPRHAMFYCKPLSLKT